MHNKVNYVDINACILRCKYAYTAGFVVVVAVDLNFFLSRCDSSSSIIAWMVPNTSGHFSFSRTNLSLLCPGLLILFRRKWKVIISKSWSLPVSAPGKFRVLALFTIDRKRFLTRM